MRTLAQLGTIMQIAYVPADFDGALRFWTETMRVGPFYIQDISLPTLKYYGEPTDALFSVAIAYWGEIQIEVIAQHNDAPSIYRAWREQQGEGVQHTCIVVADINEARQAAEAAGGVVAQEAIGDDFGVLYVDTGGGPGTMLELVKPSAAMLARFARIKADSIGWDGSEPLRRFT